jgi:uncharacterized protein YyaL (SSP411 family)
MSQGGIYDHLGGGYARYATDAAWLVPHFEKMLYDNAQLVELLTLAWQETGNPLFAERVAETIGFLLREMRVEGGAFAAALDADSDGEEGLFYTWTTGEIDALLPPALAARVKQHYDIRPGGTWEGRGILHRNHPLSGTDAEDEDEAMIEARAILRAHRDTRPRPARDDKVLTDWNALTIRALAQAGLAFERPDWIKIAARAFTVVTALTALPGGRLAHVWCKDRVGPPGLIDDHAQLAAAAIALYQTGGDETYLDQAAAWLETAHRHHWDKDGGGYFHSADDAADVPIRTKPGFDSVVPSGNGAMAEALALMHLATGETVWRDRAEAVLTAFSDALPDQGATMAVFLDARRLLDHPLRVTIQGPADDPIAARLQRVALAEALAPPMLVRRITDGPAQALICRGPVCLAPVTDPADIEAMMRE